MRNLFLVGLIIVLAGNFLMANARVYNLFNDWTGLQGSNGWYFWRYRNGWALFPHYGDRPNCGPGTLHDCWYDVSNECQLINRRLIIVVFHPNVDNFGGNGAVSTRWKNVEGSGNFHVTGYFYQSDCGGGDGVIISIYSTETNSYILSPQHIQCSRRDFDFVTYLSLNSELYFTVSNNGNNNYDTTNVDITIEPVLPTNTPTPTISPTPTMTPTPAPLPLLDSNLSIAFLLLAISMILYLKRRK